MMIEGMSVHNSYAPVWRIRRSMVEGIISTLHSHTRRGPVEIECPYSVAMLDVQLHGPRVN